MWQLSAMFAGFAFTLAAMHRPGFLLILALVCFPALALAKQPPSPPIYGVRMERTWIPMPDGVRLAATLYVPDGAKPGEKFPALLEYLPYRKDDGTAARDYPMHSYFCKRGYVTARVDIRGTGASEGRAPEREYSQQEQRDGEEVIAWLASQPWSNGSVGMLGISWGGFNSIQMAMRRPPALKAILAVDATEKLFHDDVHYMDGMMHIDEFELAMDLTPAIPGAPEFGPSDEALLARFDVAPWSLNYMKQQRNGKFWHEPIRPFSNIQIPCFLIGGWLDGYRDSVPAMLEQVKAPVRALIGPWNHTFPNDAEPGPAVEWREDAVRWFDQWLKGRDTGVLDDPKLTVYMRHWHPPDATLPEVPGEWRAESAWPPRAQQTKTLFLQPNHTLGAIAAGNQTHQLKYVPTMGVEAGFWWGELLTDQRPVDAFSLVYDSAPLDAEVAILGHPHALLRASANAPLANWFARLSDVAPDGTVTLVTGAGLAGAQRESAEHPRELEPGKLYPLDIELHVTSWVFPRGHRIRLAISNALWPMIWPTPHALTTTLALGGAEGSRLALPVVPLTNGAAPVLSPPQPSEHLTGYRSAGYTWPGTWTTLRDQVAQKTTVTWRGVMAEENPWGKETDHEQLTYELSDAHPELNSVIGEIEQTYELKDRTLTWRGHLAVTSDAKNFFYKYTREVFKDGRLLRSRTWEETIPRDYQ